MMPTLFHFGAPFRSHCDRCEFCWVNGLVVWFKFSNHRINPIVHFTILDVGFCLDFDPFFFFFYSFAKCFSFN
jgi:hypothetical protein